MDTRGLQLVEPGFWTPEWTPTPGKRPNNVQWYDRVYLGRLEEIGVNHVALNLRFNQVDIEDTLERLADEVLPDFGE